MPSLPFLRPPLRPIRLHLLRDGLLVRCTPRPPLPLDLLLGLGLTGGLLTSGPGCGACPAHDAGRTLQGLDVALELDNLGLPGLDGLGDLAQFSSFATPLGAFTGSAGVSDGVRRVDMFVDAVQPSDTAAAISVSGCKMCSQSGFLAVLRTAVKEEILGHPG